MSFRPCVRLAVVSERISSTTKQSKRMMSSSVQLLGDFSTCELSDALIKLKHPTGGLIPDIHRVSPYSHMDLTNSRRICGPAYTIQMVLASNEDAPKLSLEAGTHFVDTIEEGSVVVVGAPPEAKNAVWGGLMTAGAQVRGALGVVISGRVRDLAEHREAGFPVFARGHSTLGQSPFTRPSAIQVPLIIETPSDSSSKQAYEFPPTIVSPGDLVVADADGVVCVPKGMVEEVAQRAKQGREIDARCMEDIRKGVGVGEAFKRHRGG